MMIGKENPFVSRASGRLDRRAVLRLLGVSAAAAIFGIIPSPEKPSNRSVVSGEDKIGFLKKREDMGQRIVRVDMSDPSNGDSQRVRRVFMDLKEWSSTLPDKDNFTLPENEGICFIYQYDMSSLSPSEVGPDGGYWNLDSIPLEDGRRVAYAFEVSNSSTKLEIYFACENPQNLK